MNESKLPPWMPSSRPFTKLVDGFPVPGLLPENNYRATLSYQPRDDDVFVVTYPKCGATLAQHVLLLLFRGGKPLDSILEFVMSAPYIDFMGPQAVEKMPRPGAIKTHLPYHLAPRFSKAKYIYISRNPKDCCVSHYHHMTDVDTDQFIGTFDQFFEDFMTGDIDYGDYFDHLLGWYAHRNDSNVLFLTYEQMKENPEESFLKMASFLDEKLLAEPLRSDPAKLKRVVQLSSFEHMKEQVNNDRFVDDLTQIFQDLDKSGLPPEVLQVFAMFAPPTQAEALAAFHQDANFVRRGVIGDWRHFFSPDQNARMDEKFSERTTGTDLPDLWSEHMRFEVEE